MTRLMVIVAIALGLTYVVWAVVTYPIERPPTSLALGSFLCSMGAIASRRRGQSQ